MRGPMARLAGITMALAVLCAAPASARVLQPAALPHVVAGSAYVRVNQVGYSTSAAKRAYLMSSVNESGATFSVMDGSTAVFTAPIGLQLGSWSSNFPHVYALDFPTTAAGTYTITVSGPAAATSPSFAVGDGSAVYAGAIGNALNFYQDERDGPAYIPSPLRTAPAHLNDENAMTYRTPKVDADGNFQGSLKPLGTRINAAGGWWDAGDYLKFVQTESYTTGVLLSGLRDFPAQMGPHSGADFTAETTFGVRWLLRMWNDRTKTLYYQVGVGEANGQTTGDHDIWRLPQADDTWGGHSKADRYIRHRPVFRAAKPGSPISPNLAGRDAAAFAECYQVFKSTDPELAARCLRSAEDIFALADTSPRGHLLTVIPFDFYPESEWRDDLEWGATELYLATKGGGLPPGLPHANPRFYLKQAARWAHAYITGPNDAADTLNLYDVSGLGPLRPVPGDLDGGRVARPRRDAARAARRSPKAARPRECAGPQGSLPVRVPVGRVRHHVSRLRPVGDGQRVRSVDRHQALQQAGQPLAGQRAGRERLGRLPGGGGRHTVPALHAAPGREPGGLAERGATGAGRGGRRGAERRHVERQGGRDARLPGAQREPLQEVQQRRQVQGQRAVMVDGGAGHRPDGDQPAGVRAGRGRAELTGVASRYALGRPSPPGDGWPALLAQLVEHFHGKEGVNGSSPLEGFVSRPLGERNQRTRSDVCQLARQAFANVA